MYSEQQYIDLEQEELSLTEETIAVMLLLMASLKGNLEKELRNFYQQYGKDGVVTYSEARKWISEQDHRRRLTVLLIYLTSEFDATLVKLEKHFRKFLTEVIGKESTFFGINVDVNKLLSKPWGLDDLCWLDRLEADVNLWKATLVKDLKQAMHRGARLDDVLFGIEKRFGSIDKVLKKLGISESTAIGSLSRQAIFKELGVTQYKFYTRADERTCEQCGALHNRIFPISAFEVGVTASPIHPYCRCWEIILE